MEKRRREHCDKQERKTNCCWHTRWLPFGYVEEHRICFRVGVELFMSRDYSIGRHWRRNALVPLSCAAVSSTRSIFTHFHHRQKDSSCSNGGFSSLALNHAVANRHRHQVFFFLFFLFLVFLFVFPSAFLRFDVNSRVPPCSDSLPQILEFFFLRFPSS